MTRNILIFTVLSMMVASCSSVKDASSSKVFQKRKYTKGFYVNLRTPELFKNDGKIHSALSSDRAEIEASRPETLPSQTPGEKRVAGAQIPPEIYASVDDDQSPYEVSTNHKKSYSQHSFNTRQISTTSTNDAMTVASQPDISQGIGQKTTPVSAILSFLFSIASLFVFALPFGLLALILGVVGVSKVDSDRTRYKGRGLAIFGMILGLIAVMVFLLVILPAA